MACSEMRPEVDQGVVMRTGMAPSSTTTTTWTTDAKLAAWLRACAVVEIDGRLGICRVTITPRRADDF